MGFLDSLISNVAAGIHSAESGVGNAVQGAEKSIGNFVQGAEKTGGAVIHGIQQASQPVIHSASQQLANDFTKSDQVLNNSMNSAGSFMNNAGSQIQNLAKSTGAQNAIKTLANMPLINKGVGYNIPLPTSLKNATLGDVGNAVADKAKTSATNFSRGMLDGAGNWDPAYGNNSMAYNAGSYFGSFGGAELGSALGAGKMSFNVPQAVKGAAVSGGLYIGASKLAGQKADSKNLGSSLGLGLIAGITHAPPAELRSIAEMVKGSASADEFAAKLAAAPKAVQDTAKKIISSKTNSVNSVEDLYHTYTPSKEPVKSTTAQVNEANPAALDKTNLLAEHAKQNPDFKEFAQSLEPINHPTADGHALRDYYNIPDSVKTTDDLKNFHQTVHDPNASSYQTYSALHPTAMAPKAFDYKPSPNLTPQERGVETRFGDYLTKNYGDAVKEYTAKYGNELNSDFAKELSHDYQGDRTAFSAAVHEPSSAFINKLYEEKVKEPDPTGKNIVTFTAGGSGAGKGTALNKIPGLQEIKRESQIFFDGTMGTYNSAQKRIELALQNGKKVIVAYVHTHPVEAYNRVLSRGMHTGRMVPADFHVGSHVSSLETVQKLEKLYHDDPNVIFHPIDNTGTEPSYLSLDELHGKAYNKDDITQQIHGNIDKAYETGSIPQNIRDAAKRPVLSSTVEKDTASHGQEPQGSSPGEKGSSSAEVKQQISYNPEKQQIEQTDKPGAFQFTTKHLNSTEDLNQMMADVANRNATGVQDARRGTISFEETRKMADALGMSSKDLLNRKAGTVYNAEKQDAANRIFLKGMDDLKSIGQQISDLQKAGKPVPSELQSAQMEAAFRAQGLAANAIGNLSETGRALNAAKMFKDSLADPDKAVLAATKMFNGDKAKGAEVIKKLGQFDPTDTLGMIKFLREVHPSTPLEKISEFWYNSILSNPSTHIFNTLGNTTTTMLRLPEKAVAGGIDAALTTGGKVFNKSIQRDRYMAEAGAEATGILHGFSDGIARAAYVMRHGIKPDEANKFGFDRPQAIHGKVGAVINTPTRMLDAADQIYRGVNYQMDIYAQALRSAKQSGLSGKELQQHVADLVANPTPEMVDKANKNATYYLFQSQSNTGSAVAHFRDNVFSLNLGKLGKFQPMQYVIPFINIAVNGAKYGLERTPLGVASAAHAAINRAGKGEVSDRLARAFVGSALMVPLAQYVAQGNVTGALPSNPTDKKAFQADGKQPFAIKIGDKWLAYNRIEPFNTILSQMALWHDQMQQGINPMSMEGVSAFVGGVAQNVSGQTFTQGIGNLIQAIQDPKRYGNQELASIVGGFVPSPIAAGARAMDPVSRKPTNIVESVEARLPVLSKNVPAVANKFDTGGVAQRHDANSWLDQITGTRITQDSGQNLYGAQQTVDKLQTQAKTEKTAVQQVAKDLYTAVLNAKDQKEADQVISQYKQAGKLSPSVVKEFKTYAKQQATASIPLVGDERILQGKQNAVKVKYLQEKTKGMSDEQLGEYIGQLASKKLVNRTVVEDLLKTRSTQTTPKTTPTLPVVAH